ncbi:MAG TPA: LuxR C-terminal-related transcriptional regulator [Candidatus Acidoferrum sp.]|nr:LuxR C-terminal-related transcriptional regulator [Candidatus Acidoferrum sp.]
MNDTVPIGRRRALALEVALGPLESALAGAGDGACAVGPDGRIVLWNRAAEKMLGYAARDALGRPCCDVFVGHDDDGNRLCYQGCHFMKLIDLGETIQSFDMKTRSKAGHPVWLNVSILRVADAGSGGPVTVHLFRDVTVIKELLSLVHERITATAEREAGVDHNTVLSRRELEVLRLLAIGLNTRSLAERLHVSPATVRNHVQNLFAKLEVHSRLEAVAYASRHRLL